MKKRTIVLLIVLILLMSFLLSSCLDINIKDSDLSLKITESMDDLLDTTFLKIESKISIDGKLTESILGVVDRNMNQAKISINEASYYYFSKTRFQGDASGVAIVDYMAFPKFIDLMGTTLLNFNFDSGNFSSIKENNGVIIAEFIGKGASYSFNTSIELSGGTLSFFFTNGKISKTVFSSTYQQNSATHIYTAVTTYQEETSLWENSPKVVPSNSPKYARYILAKLSAAHPDKTFRLLTTDYNTSFKVSGIISEEKLMSKVFVKSANGLHVATIIYLTPQLFIGIGGDVKSIDICYDDDNKIYYMYINDINDNNKYLLN
jgi:hypothetical protein